MIKNKNLDVFSINNKISIILGGSGLIGKEICDFFIKSGSIVHNLDVKKSSKFKHNKNYHFHYFDLKDYHHLEIKLEEILKKIKNVDIFVNCSFPVTDDWKLNNFDQIKLKSFRDNLNFQLVNSSWILKEIANLMKKNKTNGSIVNLGSIYGFLGQDLSVYNNTKMRENIPYSIIKGGVINLTRQMASYYGKYNIRVNTVSPGGILGHVKGSSVKQDKNFIQNYSRKVPLKRLCKSAEVSTVVQFLASDASSYMTGTNLILDGGWSII